MKRPGSIAVKNHTIKLGWPYDPTAVQYSGKDSITPCSQTDCPNERTTKIDLNINDGKTILGIWYRMGGSLRYGQKQKRKEQIL